MAGKPAIGRPFTYGPPEIRGSVVPDILGFIPARGGSKGLPNKNKQVLAGKPLVQWTIEAALASVCTRVVVSSADPDILRIAIGCGASILLRPAALDDLGEIDKTTEHLLECVDRPDYLVRLQPTSPLRVAEDIDAGMALLRKCGGCVLGVSEARQHPNLLFWEDTSERVVGGQGWRRPRQEYRRALWVNGAFYGASMQYYDKHGFGGPHVDFMHMPASRSLDIDDPFDWMLAEAAIQNVREGGEG